MTSSVCLSSRPVKWAMRKITEFDLLAMFYEKMVEQGYSRNLVRLSLDSTMQKEISKKFRKDFPISEIEKAIDICLANEWLEHSSIGAGKYGMLQITTAGLGVVKSKMRQEERLRDRTKVKKLSDYIESHKGLFLFLGFLVALGGLLVSLGASE